MATQQTNGQGIAISVSDVSGQKSATVDQVPGDATIGDLVNGLLGEMNLPRNDPAGQPLAYQARLDREGRLLNGNEVVNRTLQDNDHIVLQPNVDAG